MTDERKSVKAVNHSEGVPLADGSRRRGPTLLTRLSNERGCSS